MSDGLFEIEGLSGKPPAKELTSRKKRQKEEVFVEEPLIDFGDDIVRRSNILSMIGHIQSYSAANYIGNKKEIAEQLPVMLDKYGVKYDSVFDAFSGSGIVSLIFALLGKKVTSNDLLAGSALQAECLLNVNPSILKEEDWMFLIKSKFAPKTYKSIGAIYENADKLLTHDEINFLDQFRANLVDRFGNTFQVGYRIDHGEVVPNLLTLDDGSVSNPDPRIALALYALVMHINSHCFVGGRYYNGQTLAKLQHRLEHQQNEGLQFFENFYDHTAHRIQFPSPLRTLNNLRAVYNSDILPLLKSKKIQADLLYLDPPYGGDASDYVYKYKLLEEYLQGRNLPDETKIGGSRFDKKKGFAEEFEALLACCGDYPAWLISFNATSFAKMEDICAIIKKFRNNVVVEDTAKLYKYRKERTVATDKEFLILARE